MGKAKQVKHVRGVKDRQLVKHGVPVQAYIPYEVFRRFRIKYKQHGAVSKLIRRAFLLAVEEDDTQSPPRDEHEQS